MAKDNNKKSAGGGGQPHRAPATSDPRFARLHTDPRFLRPKKDDVKVKIDERFKDLLEAGDKKGAKSGPGARKIDKYGRKVQKGQSEVEQMRRFYRLDEDAKDAGGSGGEDASEGDEEDDEDDEEEEEEEEEEGIIDYARGEGELESSSEEESSSASSENDSEDESSEDSDDDEDVMIGPSSVVDKAKKKQKAASSYRYGDEDDEDDGYGDIGEIDLNEDEDESIYAQLDAQAQRAIAEGGIEGESDNDQDAAGSSKAAKGKGKQKKAKSKKDKIPRGDDTYRLAVVNMDWDHVRAKDLYKVFSSIVSENPVEPKRRVGAHAPAVNQIRGSLLSVRVYPSDFGKERMAQEDAEGPPKEIFKKKGKKSVADSDDSDDEEEINEKTIIQVDEGGEFDEEALRKYQLDRLRYYYAVATFDSKETARHVYNEIDGTEMERTANIFDLRFVPDEMEFPDGEEGRDAEFRDEATEDVGNYKGVDFMTDALRHSKVKLTWDQDDPERSKLTRLVSRGGLTKEQLRDDDFKAYLASATESEGESEDEGKAQAQRDKLRALFNLDGADDGSYKGKRGGGVFDDEDEDRAEQGDMEITFMPGLSEAAARKSKGQKKDQDEEETTLDKYKRKMKEKREKRKAKAAERAGQSEAGSADEDAAGAAAGGDAGGMGFDDPFFASDNDMDMEAALAAEFDSEAAAPSKKATKDGKKGEKTKPSSSATATAEGGEDAEELARQRAELALLIGDDEDDERTKEGRQHFDMKDILRVESGKDVKRAKLLKRLSKKKQRQEAEYLERKGKPLVQESFEIDTKDQRFTALMEDHRYAIDPSHPSFVKTNAMKKLLEERQRRQRNKSDSLPTKADKEKPDGAKDGEGRGDAELASLVDKLKKRSASTAAAEGAGGPPKKKKQQKQKAPQ
ncbi:pre-rRNA-processing protein esf1 [Thecaphora frezii]